MDLSIVDFKTLVIIKGNLIIDLDLHPSIRVLNEVRLLEKFR